MYMVGIIEVMDVDEIYGKRMENVNRGRLEFRVEGLVVCIEEDEFEKEIEISYLEM